MKTITENKKGGIFDLFLLIPLLFAFAIIALISARITRDINNAMGNSSITQNSEIVNQAFDNAQHVGAMGDTVFMIIFAGFILVLIVTALLVDFHPAFFFLFMILVILGVVIAVPISNGFEELATSPTMVGFQSPLVNEIMFNLPYIMAIVGTILLVTMYARSRI